MKALVLYRLLQWNRENALVGRYHMSVRPESDEWPKSLGIFVCDSLKCGLCYGTNEADSICFWRWTILLGAKVGGLFLHELFYI